MRNIYEKAEKSRSKKVIAPLPASRRDTQTGRRLFWSKKSQAHTFFLWKIMGHRNFFQWLGNLKAKTFLKGKWQGIYFFVVVPPLFVAPLFVPPCLSALIKLYPAVRGIYFAVLLMLWSLSVLVPRRDNRTPGRQDEHGRDKYIYRVPTGFQTPIIQTIQIFHGWKVYDFSRLYPFRGLIVDSLWPSIDFFYSN